MTPTNKLRFVEREIHVTVEPMFNITTGKTIRILQQWWEDRNITLSIHIEDKDGNPLPSPNRGEWRDVPVETEA
jgi:hypothetical protein